MVDGLLKNTTLVEFDIGNLLYNLLFKTSSLFFIGDNSIGNNGVIIIGNLLRRNSTLVKLWIGMFSAFMYLIYIYIIYIYI